MARPKPQRIRDPIHNLIEFGSDQFESTLWRLIQTAPFQRLRRIRQLGFSEFVFPGATHTRLPERHPILRFIAEPSNLDRALALDDSVFWGALSMLIESEDEQVRRWSSALRERRLLCCFDIKRRVEDVMPATKERKERQARVKLVCDAVVKALQEHNAGNPNGLPRFLIDQYARDPYKRFQDSKSPLNQIQIRVGEGPPTDMAEFSAVIANAEPFNLCRAYVFRDDKDAESTIGNEVRTKTREIADGDA